jgi:hypothetical protein
MQDDAGIGIGIGIGIDIGIGIGIGGNLAILGKCAFGLHKLCRVFVILFNQCFVHFLCCAGRW